MGSQTESTAPLSTWRQRILRGTAIELGNYGLQQILRLGSNLILTRLLFPAAFGMSSMVGMVSIGLVLLSEVGVQQFLIQSPHGEDPRYINTAFTFQAIRGCVIALIVAALAYPAAWFYREPQLVPLVYVSAIQLVFAGLHSTSVYTLRRRLNIGWIAILELGQVITNIAIMIPWAWLRPSVWPLVASSTISTFIFGAATHFLPVGYRNRFAWDKEAYKEISKFGRWIFGSTAIGFLGSQGDRMLLGRFLGSAWLGLYSVALSLTEAVSAVAGRLVSGIIYPVLSQAARENGSDISKIYYRVRLRLDVLSMTAVGFLTGFGSWIIDTLWDARYADAAWILRILCVKVAVASWVNPGETCLFALGNSRIGFSRSVARLVVTGIGIPIGWHWGGIMGVIWASALTEIPSFFLIWPKLHELKILRIKRELLAPAVFALAVGIALLVLPFLPNIHVRH